MCIRFNEMITLEYKIDYYYSVHGEFTYLFDKPTKCSQFCIKYSNKVYVMYSEIILNYFRINFLVEYEGITMKILDI